MLTEHMISGIGVYLYYMSVYFFFVFLPPLAIRFRSLHSAVSYKITQRFRRHITMAESITRPELRHLPKVGSSHIDDSDFPGECLCYAHC
jgi:hypothetical protein